jgi:Zn-dependent peptidase ImmA (M78 family)
MTDEVDKEMEREANNFAASLLMPEAQVHSVAATGASITAAAAQFGVSDVAMRWRYFNLGIPIADDDPGGV